MKQPFLKPPKRQATNVCFSSLASQKLKVDQSSLSTSKCGLFFWIDIFTRCAVRAHDPCQMVCIWNAGHRKPLAFLLFSGQHATPGAPSPLTSSKMQKQLPTGVLDGRNTVTERHPR
eukprot:5440329-Amphidinium_carterae.1